MQNLEPYPRDLVQPGPEYSLERLWLIKCNRTSALTSFLKAALCPSWQDGNQVAPNYSSKAPPWQEVLLEALSAPISKEGVARGKERLPLCSTRASRSTLHVCFSWLTYCVVVDTTSASIEHAWSIRLCLGAHVGIEDGCLGFRVLEFGSYRIVKEIHHTNPLAFESRADIYRNGSFRKYGTLI